MLNIKMQSNTISQTQNALAPKIAVVGVGGAGGNAVNNMISSNLEGCDFVVCNTDSQALGNSLADTKVQLGEHVTGGLGAGSKPEIGRASAEESLDEVMQYLEGANMAFVTAGMGGGTGTGAAPVIAKACRDMGILTIGVVTKPFHFEGAHRMKMAEEGLKEMQEVVDTLIVIPNQNLFRVANEKTTFAEAFQMADSVLQSGVRGVTDLMVRPGLVNLDFADIRTAMMEMGKAMMGTGESSGEKRAIEAAESAINNPLLDDVSMKGAHGVIINVTGGYDMTLFEADEAANRIRDEVDPDANIIFGATFDDKLEGKMRVSIVATGIEKEAAKKTKPVGGTQKFTRATPNTVSATSGLSASKPTASTPPQTKVPTASLPSADQVRNVVPAASDSAPEADLFEQQQFSSGQGASSETAEAQNTALRGTRYKNAFIPPKPIGLADRKPYQAYTAVGAPSAPVPQEMQAQETQASEPIKSPGLVLNPPKLPNPAEKPKTPSLFERISGSVQQGIEGITGSLSGSPAEPQSQRVQTPPTMSAGTMSSLAPSSPSQGSLNIDSSSEPAKPGEDLDIPAFLRRQAN